MADAERAVKSVLPTANAVRVPRPKNCTQVVSYSRHWVCLFPQHGRGRKQHRKIELVDWQRRIVERYPWEFIRGLIHSDGCRIIAQAKKRVAGEIKHYEYACYFFSNRSDDIHRLLQWALDMVGVEWRRSSFKQTSIRKRASVALMDLHVGPKF